METDIIKIISEIGIDKILTISPTDRIYHQIFMLGILKLSDRCQKFPQRVAQIIKIIKKTYDGKIDIIKIIKFYHSVCYGLQDFSVSARAEYLLSNF